MNAMTPHRLKTGATRHRRAFVIIELIASLGLMGLLAALLGSMMVSYQRADLYYMTQRRLQLAVEGQMETFRAGQPLPDTGSTIALPGKVALTIDHRLGVGEWSGLVFVEIRGSTTIRPGRSVTAILRTYLSSEMSP